MKISVFGLGYVGAVTAACLARDGHEVIGVDISTDKVEMIARGESPIVETGLEALLKQGVTGGMIRATTDFEDAVFTTDISLISVGTPPTRKGEPDLSYVYNVCRQIGEAVRSKGQPHTVVLRSTVPPGTLHKCLDILCDIAGEQLVSGAFNPEFLREGTAIKDYDKPPYTVIGTDNERAERAVREMYAAVDAEVIVVKPEVAEMVKSVANSWHAVKVGFANEIGRLAKAFQVDGRSVMDLIVKDTKLNVSPAYMRPGFAYGGSCLPKDLSSLLYHAKALNVSVPVLSSLPVTNEIQIHIAAEEIKRLGVRKVAFLGLAFKSGTDDLRESPAVQLIKQIIGEGCEVKIYDSAVYQARLMGTNLAYLRSHLPHFERMLVGRPEEALEGSELAVLSYIDPEFSEALGKARKGMHVLDLAGQFTEPPKEMEYYGIAW